MMDLLMLLVVAASEPTVLLILKVSVVTVLAAGVVAVLGRRSAAVRHFVWSTALAATLVLAAGSALGTARVTVPIPVAPETFVRDVRSVRDALAPQAVTARETRSAPSTRAVDRAPANTPSASFTNSAPAPSTQISVRAILFRLWIAGVALLLLWRALGHIGLALLTRRATPVRDGAWYAALHSAAREAGVDGDVRLLESSEVGAPVTWGHRSPVILIPSDAATWTSERRRVVLLHELAHIERSDYAVQLGASIACALYWFHPLIWVAARRLRNEAERACDDRVLGAGTPGADYASHLLSVARGARTLRLTGAVAIGMARRSTLEGRMLAAIDDSVVRTPVSRRAAYSFGAGVATFALALGALYPVAVAAAPATLTAALTAPNVVVTASVPTAATRMPIAKAQTQSVRRATTTARSDQTADSTFTKSVAATRGGTLEIDLAPGGALRIEGWNENRVEVRGRLAGRDWRDVTVDLRRDGNRVLLISELADRRNSSSTSNEYEIRVPREFNVDVRSGGGGLAITSVTGRFSGSIGGGTIALDHLGGEARLSTGGGEVSVTDSDLDGTVSTGGGRVVIARTSGGLRGSTGGGGVYYGDNVDVSDAGRDARGRDVTVDRGVLERAGRAVSRAVDRVVAAHDEHVTRGRDGSVTTTHSGDHAEVVRTASGAVHITKAGGAITIDDAPNGASATTGGGDIRIGTSSAAVRATTGGGTIHVGPVAGSVTATTGAGDVEISLSDVRGEAQNVSVTTGLGRVIVTVPASFSGRIDLEAAFTERYGSVPRITSPWNLETETTREWDDRNGTPRRYVRAGGTVGNGGGVIRIRNVNGDIEIRRGR